MKLEVGNNKGAGELVGQGIRGQQELEGCPGKEVGREVTALRSLTAVQEERALDGICAARRGPRKIRCGTIYGAGVVHPMELHCAANPQPARRGTVVEDAVETLRDIASRLVRPRQHQLLIPVRKEDAPMIGLYGPERRAKIPHEIRGIRLHDTQPQE